MKPGYKLTEVGLIPEEWEVHPLRTCLIAPPDYGINSAAVPFSDRLPKYIRITDITEEGRFSEEKPVSVNHADSESYYLRGGDVVFARTGASVGKSYRYELKDGTLVFAGFLIRVGPDKNKLLSEYLAAYATTGPYWNWVKLMSMRSGQPGINGQEYGRLPVPIPPLIEQRAIAQALSDVDGLLGGLDRLIAKKRDLKQATMQQLLTGQTRLPGFKGEWEVKTFAEVFDYLPTATNSRSDLDDTGDTYYIHYGDIHTRFHNHLDFRTSQPPRIDRSLCRNAAHLKNGDWVMADASEDYDGVGKTVEIHGLEANINAISGLHTFVLRERSPTFAPGFKGHLGNMKSLHEQYLRVATGMKVYGVSKTALKDLELPVPSLPEQTAIASVLSEMDAELAALEQQRDKTRALKQGMMQELLTGRTRLL